MIWIRATVTPIEIFLLRSVQNLCYYETKQTFITNKTNSMKVEKINIHRENTSCFVCNQGKLGKSGESLIYPYNVVFRISGNRLVVDICEDCLKEISNKTSSFNNQNNSNHQ